MISYKQIIDAWDSQTDKSSEWDQLGFDEKMVWCVHCGDNLFRHMEDAPKDGTYVILKWKHNSSWDVARWEDDKYGWQPMNYEEWGANIQDKLFDGWKPWGD